MEFPAAADIPSVDKKPGWNLDPKKDSTGKIVGAIWSGSSIAPREVSEFSFVARNPGGEAKLVWKVVQIYVDEFRCSRDEPFHHYCGDKCATASTTEIAAADPLTCFKTTLVCYAFKRKQRSVLFAWTDPTN